MKKTSIIKVLCSLLLSTILFLCLWYIHQHTANAKDVVKLTICDNTALIDDIFSLPVTEGMHYETNQNGDIYIKKNDSIIGGISKYRKPSEEFPDLLDRDSDLLSYVSRLGISVDRSNLSAHMISTGIYGGWEVWLKTSNEDITHNLLPYSKWIYDIWFDMSVDSRTEYPAILENTVFVK